MSLLGAQYQERPDKFATFKCPMCGKVEKQLRTVLEVMHLCPKTKTVRIMKREG